MISIRSLRKRYPGESRNALTDVTLSFPDKGLVFLVGSSGAGKTTLVSILGGMEPDFEGEVDSFGYRLDRMNGKELADYRRSVVGFSFQGGFLEDGLTAEAEIEKPLLLLGLSKAERKKRVTSLLVEFGLAEVSRHPIKSLSGGERKRVSLARAMAKKPPLLILDEPTAGLDAKTAQTVLSAMIRLAKTALVLVITHDETFLPYGQWVRLSEGSVVSSSLDAKPKRLKGQAEPKPLSRLSLLRMAIASFFFQWKRLGPALFAMALAISVAGFAAILVSGIGDGLQSVIGTTLDPLSCLVKPKSQEHVGFSDAYLLPETVSKAEEVLPGATQGSGVVWLKDVNDVCTPESGFSLILENWQYPAEFGMNRIADAAFLGHRKDLAMVTPLGDAPWLQPDEVLLGLSPSLLSDFQSQGRLPRDSQALAGYLEEGKAKLTGKVGVEGLKGEKPFDLTIRGIYLSDQVSLCHTDTYFPYRFFVNRLGFLPSGDKNVLDAFPATVKMAGVVYVQTARVGEYYRAFQLADAFRAMALVKFSPAEGSLVTPLGMQKKSGAEAYPGHAFDMVLNPNNHIVGYSLSSPVYGYVSGGFYEGFVTPVFVSPKKESLNAIMDANAITEMDIRGYSFASEELPEKVMPSSLADAVLGKGILFASPTTQRLALGRFPASDNEIGISTGLAKTLYRDPYSALGKKLGFLMLDSVTPLSDGYANGFMSASLRISCLYEEDRPMLFHDPFFPLAFAFSKSRLNPRMLCCDAFVLRFKDEASRDKTVPKLRLTYPSYSFSLPIQKMADELQATLDKVSLALGAFALVSVVLSGLLLALTVFLTMKREERKIGDLLALGVTPKGVQAFYLIRSFGIGALSFLNGSLGLILIRFEASRELREAFGGFELGVSGLPFALAGLVSFGLSLLTGWAISLKARKISPLRAFKL